MIPSLLAPLVNECPRHAALGRNGGPYYVAKCTHVGDRFVVKIRARDSQYVTVDYVEDAPGETMVVETNDWLTWDEDAINATYDALVERMVNDDARSSEGLRKSYE